MNDDIARTTAKYLSRKAREGVIVAAYPEASAGRLTLHIYQDFKPKTADELANLIKRKRAAVFHRGEQLADYDAIVASGIFPIKPKGGAA